MRDWQSLAHVRWECKYHIVWVPKYRRKVLYGRVRRRFAEIVRDLCRQLGVEVIEGHAMVDHVHLYVSFAPKYTESLALDFSKATLAGSILQVAHKALQAFSANSTVPPSVAGLGITAASPQIRFSVGREVHEIPAGLLIYAGRIQYNHDEEGRPKNPIARAVFDALLSYYYNDMTFDMAYELEWPTPRPVSHYIVRHELGWFSPTEYVADIRAMLSLPPP